ncbi:hypothetical protein [Vibrio antiquarius]|uniref:hypothetical protein n=1 Tax=Vibrio antiquarius (strain Ex25) TaxID=150340 RepID=UPI0026587DC8|nr:hypothetical protein [Vibrio antiquarius]MCR9548349.1 hypothetical protein [Vibrio antiquarius]
MSESDKILVVSKLQPLVDIFNELIDTIDASNLPDNHLSDSWGGHVPTCTKEDISTVFYNAMQKLKLYEKEEPPIHSEILEAHVNSLRKLKANLPGYCANQQTLQQAMPTIISSIYFIISDLEYELFSWDVLADKQAMPRRLVHRLNGVKSQIDELETDTSNLKDVAKEINEAHQAAESLPADLQTLRQTRTEIQKEQHKVKVNAESILEEMKTAQAEANSALSQANLYKSEIEDIKSDLESAKSDAQKIMDECDDALQVATTQGLAAGFDQKAKELRFSIYLYIVGLIVALGVGAWLGKLRVDEFSQVLNQSLTAGQAILHSILSILSIGAPLWLAWICTQQINHRFRLSEDYSYKATVAKSFMGFSRLSERFGGETEERLFNSTLDRLDEMPLRLIDGKDYSSPWHEFVDSEAFKSAVGIFPQLAKEAGKFAQSAKLKKTDIAKNQPAKPETQEPAPQQQESN